MTACKVEKADLSREIWLGHLEHSGHQLKLGERWEAGGGAKRVGKEAAQVEACASAQGTKRGSHNHPPRFREGLRVQVGAVGAVSASNSAIMDASGRKS